MLKFKAKALMSIEELNKLEIEHKNGWVEGHLVGEWIVGDVIEADREYIVLSYWVKIDVKTVKSYEKN